MLPSRCCTLCQSDNTYDLFCGGKIYYRCRQCRLVFLDPQFYLDPIEEKARYDRYENDVEDPDYLSFLSRSFNEVVRQIRPPARGLDFGCGNGPALAAMARKAGYTMKVYDKFYADDRDVLDLTYDFITCTEVAEHLADPAKELGRLWQQLEPGGLLVIQTKRVLGDERFKTWFYRDYPTHITFFAQASFEWLAEQWRTIVHFPHDDVALFVKKADPT